MLFYLSYREDKNKEKHVQYSRNVKGNKKNEYFITALFYTMLGFSKAACIVTNYYKQ